MIIGNTVFNATGTVSMPVGGGFTYSGELGFSQGLLVGDSFSAAANWPASVTRFPLSIVAAGGDKLTDQTVTTLQANINANPNADFVIIQGGVNDLTNVGDPQTAAQIQTAVTTMQQICRSAGKQVVIMEVGPYAGSASWAAGEQVHLDNYNAWITTESAAQTDTSEIPIYAVLEGDTTADTLSLIANGDSVTYDSGDALHPNAAGYVLIGSQADTALEAIS